MNKIELNNRSKAIKLLTKMGWHATPIENKAQSGMPDLNAAKSGTEIWIEFKIHEMNTGLMEVNIILIAFLMSMELMGANIARQVLGMNILVIILFPFLLIGMEIFMDISQ